MSDVSRAKLMQMLDAQESCIVAMEACATSQSGAARRTRRPVGPANLREAVRQAAEERRGRRGGDRRSCAASEHALCRGEERRASGACRNIPDATVLRASAHAADQCAAGPPGRVRTGLSARARPSQAGNGPVGGRDDRGSRYRKGDRPALPRSDRSAHGEDRRSDAQAEGRDEGERRDAAPLHGAPDLRTFSSDRNFAAWLGLVPEQRSTSGKTRLGGVSKMGQTDIRKLLIVGAMGRIRWIIRKGVLPTTGLGSS